MRLAQLDRAFGYGPKGRGFESSSARYEGMTGMSINAAFPFFCLLVAFLYLWVDKLFILYIMIYIQYILLAQTVTTGRAEE